MTDVPAANPVTTPVVGFIEATDGVTDVQVPPVNEEESVGVDPTQMEVVPNKLPVAGGVVIVTVVDAVAFAQPPVPATV